MKTVGVLAFQGSVAEHKHKLHELGVSAKEIRYCDDLNEIDALIIPGGESTCMIRMLRRFEIEEPLAKKIKQGLPVWGTCAGAILLTQMVDKKPNTSHLAVVDAEISRNSYGSQLDSFICTENIPFLQKEANLIFIRAPRICRVGKAKNLLQIKWKGAEEIVAARQDNVLITTFHPELDSGNEFHRYFVNEYIG